MEEAFTTKSVRGTLALAERLAGRFRAGDLVAMEGPLGAGKTVFVRGLARGLGVEDERLISSPSYVLVQEYPAAVPIFHVDLYRLADPASELEELGLGEMLRVGLVLVEWADRAAEALPRPHWRLTIEPTSARARRFTLRRVG